MQKSENFVAMENEYPYITTCTLYTQKFRYAQVSICQIDSRYVDPRDSLKCFGIRTSTYKICRTEEKINCKTIFHKRICNWIPEVRDILKISWKRGEIAP